MSESPSPPAPSVARLLPYAAGLWLGYQALFFASDLWITRTGLLPAAYYLTNAVAGLVVLALALWPGAAARLGRAFLPLMVALLTAPPIYSIYMLAPRFASAPERPPVLGPTISAEGLALRILPVLLMAAVLVAWHYRWREVVGYVAAMAGLSTALLLIVNANGRLPNRPTPNAAPGAGPAGIPAISALYVNLIVVGVEALCLLIVGYCVNMLVRQIRRQRDDLAAAVRQLRTAAGTLESLTISRERNRVARELHDTLAHTLSGLTVQLEAVKAYWAVDPARAQALLDKAQDSARQGLQETRHALTALRASPLEDLGLGLALRRLAEAAAARANLELELNLPDPLPVVPPDVEQCLYRVAQEAIANVIYHAAARHMTVALHRQADSLELVIGDDGMGFVADATVPPGHFGLAGMRERARLVAGHLSIQSQAGAGTTVRLRIAEEGAAA